MTPQKSIQQPPLLDYRRQAQNQAQLQHNMKEDLPTVPHNEYPTDGMTMFCRTAPPSERSSVASPVRPSSQDSQSEYSNPTSFSSQERISGKQSPVKQNVNTVIPAISPDKMVQKKRSGFFSNSPFRRKSKHDKDGREHQQPLALMQPTTQEIWAPANHQREETSPVRQYGQGRQGAIQQNRDRSGSPDPVDPRANFQLNVGPNVFDVASPDAQRHKPVAKGSIAPQKDLDPIAQALAELKGVTKQSSTRMSADRYHGIASPAPSGTPGVPALTAQHSAVSAAQRGTPPPSYQDPPMKRLDLPQPAFTSAQMQQTTRKYVGQKQDMYGSSGNGSRPGTRGSGGDMPRSTSPLPIRSVSPKPGYNNAQSQVSSTYGRSASPNPYVAVGRPRQSQSASPTKHDYGSASSNDRYSRQVSPNDVRRAASPQPQYTRQDRPASSAGMALQLAGGPPERAYGGSQGRSGGRPMSYYGGQVNEVRQETAVRPRSKSMANDTQYNQDGRPILQYGKQPY